MYIPKIYEENRVPVLHEFLESYPFASLITMGASGLFASHIPMVFEKDGSDLGRLKCPRFPGQSSLAEFFAGGRGSGDLSRNTSLHQPNLVCGEAGSRQGGADVEL
jgi:hypothetical protein